MKIIHPKLLRNTPPATLLYMTHEQNRHRNRETSKAMTRMAETRKCPKCQRKMALKSYSDEFSFGTYCRWDDCDYKNITVREWEW